MEEGTFYGQGYRASRSTWKAFPMSALGTTTIRVIRILSIVTVACLNAHLPMVGQTVSGAAPDYGIYTHMAMLLAG